MLVVYITITVTAIIIILGMCSGVFFMLGLKCMEYRHKNKIHIFA